MGHAATSQLTLVAGEQIEGLERRGWPEVSWGSLQSENWRRQGEGRSLPDYRCDEMENQPHGPASDFTAPVTVARVGELISSSSGLNIFDSPSKTYESQMQWYPSRAADSRQSRALCLPSHGVPPDGDITSPLRPREPSGLPIAGRPNQGRGKKADSRCKESTSLLGWGKLRSAIVGVRLGR